MFEQPLKSRIKKRPRRNATALHEANFAKLARVVPCLTDIQIQDQVLILGDSRLELEVLETSKYTKTFSLRLHQTPPQTWLTHLHMKIRNYYDADVTEVLAFQHQHRLDARYEYPNPKMYQPNEKWQNNHFLGEWLDHCLRNRFIFQDELESTN